MLSNSSGLVIITLKVPMTTVTNVVFTPQILSNKFSQTLVFLQFFLFLHPDVAYCHILISPREVRNSSNQCLYVFSLKRYKYLKHWNVLNILCWIPVLFLHIWFHLNVNITLKKQFKVKTLQALTHSLPLSVILAMEELDGDEVRVSSRGRLAERDIVQVLIIGLLTFRI